MKIGDIVVISGIDAWAAHEDHKVWLPGRWVRQDEYAKIIKTLPWEIRIDGVDRDFLGEFRDVGNIFHLCPCQKFPGIWTEDALVNIGGAAANGFIIANGGRGWWAPKIYMSPYNQNKDPISMIRGVGDATTKINKRSCGL